MGLKAVAALAVLLVGSVSSTSGALPRLAPAELLASQPDAPASNIAAADLNCDGLKDMLVTRLLFRTDTTEPVSIFVNNGHGGFRDETASLFVGSAVPRTTHGRQIVIADFNGDHCDDAYIPDTGNDAPPHPGHPDYGVSTATATVVTIRRHLVRVLSFPHAHRRTMLPRIRVE
jgi:hypothetical protein